MAELEAMMKRQQVLGEFGEFAIHSEDLDAVLMEACRLVGEATGTGRAKVLEIQEGRQELFVRAGVGWAPDVVGKARLQMGERSSETYAIKVGKPVVTQDIAKDDRFDVPQFMKQAGVVSFVNVPIFVPGQHPYGVLQIDDTRPREFGDDEIEFLRTYAMILGPVIDRLHLVEERAQDRERMRASEARHSLMIESWAQAEWETDANGVVIADSPSWRAYTGQTLQEWLGDGWLDAVHPDDRDYAERQWREATAARGHVNAEFRLCAQDGDWRWTNVRAVPVLDAKGDIEKWAGMNIDIDARKRAEAAVSASEERQAFQLQLSDALASLNDPADIQAAAARVLAERLGVGWCYFNEFDDLGTHATVLSDFRRPGIPSMAGVHDLSAEKNFLDLMKSEATLAVPDLTNAEQFSAQAKAAYGALGIRSALGVPLVRGGRLAAVLLAADTGVRQWAGGDVELLKGVAERTWAAVERARTEAALHESEERLRQFGEASQDVLWIRDVKTLQWVYLTPAFETIYGLSREDALTGENFSNWQSLILPEDRADTAASIARVAAGEWVTFEYRIRRPSDGTVRWMRDTDFPITDDSGKTVLIGGIGHDFTDVRETELRLQTLVEGMPQLVWRAIDAGNWTWASPQWTACTGQHEADYVGWGWLDALHPDDREAAQAAWSHAAERGGFDVEYRLRRSADGDYHWFQTRATPVRDHNGVVIEWLGTSTDIHNLRELQARQEVLVAELQHRTRNLIGVVRATADKTARSSVDMPDFRGRFRDRLDALARVQGLLSRLNDHDRVTFDELVETELAAMDGHVERVEVRGPTGIRLRSSTVQTLAMALHELATNAVKYGALGQPQGRLLITWRLEPNGAGVQPWLHIDWREMGVVMAVAGDRVQGSGQGRELIERALPYQLGAQTSYILGPDGVHCKIAVPVSATTDGPEIDHV